uniref:DDE Tnp4 domain-containing protein n=1 Tax=Cyprinus carpio TaxID=7962 RepID=A0A8C1LR86_CYPCA
YGNCMLSSSKSQQLSGRGGRTDLKQEMRSTMNSIFRLTATLDHDIEHQTQRSYAIPALLQVLIALRFFACGTFHSVIANVFKVHKSTVCRTVHRVALALCRQIDKYLQFPSKDEEDAIAEHFFFYQFVNRKNFHSINVQLICDPDCKITNVTAEWPGSTHDARVLSESNIYRSFENGSHRGLLLGDSGYPCRSWLMTPFRNPVGDAQERYNTAQTKTRVIIERTLGQLKRRFHCLHGELRLEPARAGRVIIACVVLFNISKDLGVLMDDYTEPEGVVQPNHIVEDVTTEGHAIRDVLVQKNVS